MPKRSPKTLALILALLLCLMAGGPFSPAQAAVAEVSVLGAALAVCDLPDGVDRGGFEAALAYFPEITLSAGSPLTFSFTYALEEGAWHTLTLHAGDGQTQMPLLSLRQDVNDGSLRLPSAGQLAPLADEAYLAALLRLRALGLGADPATYAQALTPQGAMADFATLYEHFAPIYTAGMTVAEGRSLLVRKSLALGLIGREELLSNLLVDMDSPSFARMVIRYLQAAVDGIGHRSYAPIDGQRAAELISLTFSMAGLNAPDLAAPEGPLTRLSFAGLLLSALETARPGAAEAIAPSPGLFDDTQSPAAALADALGLLTGLLHPQTEEYLFLPDDPVTWQDCLARLPALIDALLLKDDADPILYARATVALDELAAFTVALAEDAPEPVTVDNGRPYGWYFGQEDTGPHSANNCMPAAAAMLLKWADESSPYDVWDMRARFPMEGDAWYPEQVTDILREHGVPHSLHTIALESMLGALDGGHILLALLNEGTGGHCVVVKGYIRQGEGLAFITYDPASPGLTLYGQPLGRDRIIGADALLRAMRHHWWNYIDISPVE